MMKKGFTLLEMMVAALLLSMLVAAVTQIFTQSSIAWRTGTAGVAQLHDVRTELGCFNYYRDTLLPNYRQDHAIEYCIAPLWDGGSLRSDRAIIAPPSEANINFAETDKAVWHSLGSGSGPSVGAFSVGVRSAGADGIWDTDDDITTYPESVQ